MVPVRCCIGAIASLLVAGAAHAAAPDSQKLIEEALSAAPPQLRDSATVINLDGTVLRQGKGDFTCLPAPPDFGGPMCLDKTWLAWMDAYKNQKPPQTKEIGFAYMLAGDTAHGGASNTEPYARTPSHGNHWVVEGPHVMTIAPDETLLASLPTTPDVPGPYVMWPGTPYAHVMWPVAERPGQRQVAAK